MTAERCAALNKSGTRCRARAVPETDHWRCARHATWYETATPDERHKLAVLEIEELTDALGN